MLLPPLLGRDGGSALDGRPVVYRAETGKYESVPVPTLQTDVGDFDFVRHELVTVTRDLDQLESKIRNDLATKMLGLINSREG